MESSQAELYEYKLKLQSTYQIIHIYIYILIYVKLLQAMKIYYDDELHNDERSQVLETYIA